MAKKNKDYIAPLELTKTLSKKFAGCFDKVEMFRKDRGIHVPMWDDICYIPINATLSIASLYRDCNINVFPSVLAATAAWRRYKQIYSFNKDLLDLLFAQADDIVVPVEILYQLPYDCIYISVDCNGMDGYFVHFDYDVNTKQTELRFTVIFQNGKIEAFMLPLRSSWTIQEGIKEVIKLAHINVKSEEFKETFKEWNMNGEQLKNNWTDTEKYMYHMVSAFIQPVLYICAENTDIEENSEQKNITRRTSEGNKDLLIDQPKDVFREIRKWDVGYKISYAMRRKGSHGTGSGGSTGEAGGWGSTKRPHSRRGHWHHYRKGKGKTELILKWTAPTFIHAELNGEETPVTENRL